MYIRLGQRGPDMEHRLFSMPAGQATRQHGLARLSGHRCKQYGATLIEVLVAVFILAIGLLGMAGMTAASIKFNQMSRMRGAGVLLVNDLAERARVNIMGFDAGGYASGATKKYSFKPELTTESGCSDIIDWKSNLLK